MVYRELLFNDLGYSGWYHEGIHDEYEGLMLLLSLEEKQDPTFQLLFSYIFFCMDKGKAEEVDLSSYVDEVIIKKLQRTNTTAACAKTRSHAGC